MRKNALRAVAEDATRIEESKSSVSSHRKVPFRVVGYDGNVIYTRFRRYVPLGTCLEKEETGQIVKA